MSNYQQVQYECSKLNVSRVEIAGPYSLIFYFSGDSAKSKNIAAHTFFKYLKSQKFHWLLDATPSYESCLLDYDELSVDHHFVISQLRTHINELPNNESAYSKTVHRIPVWYDDAFEFSDLAKVAEYSNESIERIIEIHSGKTYQVYAVGFQLGFAYLGELDDALFIPRMSVPRQKVPTGAVAIADNQTAVYPTQSPGGWHIIGLCPLDLRLKASSESPFNVADEVTFFPIDEDQYNQISAKKEPR